MKGPLILAGLAMAALPGSTANASTAAWFVRVDAREPVTLAKGETRPAFSLMPQRVFLLGGDVPLPGGRFAIPQGTLFLEIDAPGSGRVCAMARHLGSAFHCLADRDRDGTFETYFYQQVFNEFHFGSVFRDEAVKAIEAPAQLRELDPFVDIAPVVMGLRLDSGKPGGKLAFKLCVEEPSGAAQWRKGLYKTCLTRNFVPDPATGTMTIFGIEAQVARVDHRQVSVSFPSQVRVVPVTFDGTRL